MILNASSIIRLFNDEGIVWGFGGSCLLNALGVDISPRDIDMVVRLDCIERAKDLLLSRGAQLLEERPSNNVYLTRKFYTLKWQSVEVDLMADAGIQKQGEVFRLSFEEKGPWGMLVHEGQDVYLSSPFDWKIYYSLMDGREKRVSEIAEVCEALLANSAAFGHIKRAD